MLTRHATCLCGACHATTTADPVLVTACACHDCQQESGSAFGYNAFFPISAVATEGPTHAYTHTFASSRSQTAHRCATCGSPMWFTMDAVPGTIGLRAGTFLDPDFPPPGAFYYACRKHHWLTLPDGLASHDTD